MAQVISPEVLLPVVAEVFKAVFNHSPEAQQQDPIAYRHEAASFFTDLYFDIKDNIENPMPRETF